MGGDAHWQSSSSSSSTVRLKPPAHCGHADVPELGDTSGVPTSFPKRKKKKNVAVPQTH